MKSIVVIYHQADYDGIFCREIAKKFLPDATLIGWDYGDPEPEVAPDAQLYIMDLRVDGLMNHPNLIWIDHHKSSIEKHPPSIKGYRIDGVAACRLAWQWFSRSEQIENMPNAASYFGRGVEEPWAVRLAGEYDIWDKRDPNAELFQHALNSEALTPTTWDSMLDCRDTGVVPHLLNQGRAIQYAKKKENESIITNAGFTLKFEGVTFLACNAAKYNSMLFDAGVKPEHEALFGFAFRDGKWFISLYHITGKTDIDLSLIAVKYGGGGHKGACGLALSHLQMSTLLTLNA